MTAQTTISEPMRLRRGRLFAIAAAMVASAGARDLSALTPKERRYVEGVNALTPAQLAAAF